tara:strand:+ start:6006 stop:6197 length:192 start_codon:yes stop_codon:yes gene_type:complete
MKVKARLNKFHRVNPNGVLCDKDSLDKLRDGEFVEVPEDAANELLSMGFVEKAKQTKKEKGAK